jgi:hypothetical protein
MRNALLLLVLGASACAARAPRTTMHAEYSCGDVAISRDGSEVRSKGPEVLGRLSWHDDAGDHFVAWPLSPTDRNAVEFVVPSDPHQDAQQRTYDTTFGSSTSDWRMTDQQVCTARGGYNDLLARYMKGESVEDLSTSLGSSREETRGLLRKALVSLQRRYWRDR